MDQDRRRGNPVEQQIQIIDDFVAEHVDAIVIAPGDSRRLIPALKRAADQGIKLVNIDNALDADAARQAGLAPPPLVSVDNESAAAYASARRIAAGAPPGTQAAIIEGIRSADNAQARKRVALRAFAENPGIRVVASHSAEWKIDEGYKVAGRILRDHPRVTRLFAANDMMALGAIKYLREAGRRDVKVAAYDALAEAVAEVRRTTDGDHRPAGRRARLPGHRHRLAAAQGRVRRAADASRHAPADDQRLPVTRQEPPSTPGGHRARRARH